MNEEIMIQVKVLERLTVEEYHSLGEMDLAQMLFTT